MAITRSLLPSCATLVMFLLLLSFTSNAVPMSRSLNLMDKGSHGHLKYLNNIHLENVKESWEITERVTERMNLEVNDYPGSGANNRHTPRP
ncbi:hypothetical protein M8C21_028156 [Ambrosia artemisiifolia]|uniref:Transmembrane protein n=1 Tax=Ambrosia artemisiifolia TaxID=4212 RepID=A0AAD5D601_AMBAR|nr:hypothetical protein M8C21_028156 [Ambrosia artemisiifolia]